MVVVCSSVLLAAGCAAGGSISSSSAVDPASPAAEGGPVQAAPRWEQVATFSGTGDRRTGPFDIAAGAIQWRVTATCTDGTVRVGLDGETSPLVTVDKCPGNAFGFSIRTGPATLDVAATGGWEVVVDQQVDTPVAEPVLAGMTEQARLASGAFYGIDQKGSGTATLYRLPDGDRALRLDPFLVTRNADLFVWVSEAAEPTTSEEALRAPHVQIDRLKATAGAQNYVLPDSVALDRVRSVIVWCEPVRTAYAAATLLR
jgi:hypothetical protein